MSDNAYCEICENRFVPVGNETLCPNCGGARENKAVSDLFAANSPNLA